MIKFIITHLGVILFFLNSSYAAELEIKSFQPKLNQQDQQEIKINQNEYDSIKIRKAVNDSSLKAQENAQDAKESFIEANKIAEVANIISEEKDSVLLAQIAQSHYEIELSRKKIAKSQLLLTQNLKETNQNLDDIAGALENIETKYSQKKLSDIELRKLYDQVSAYWRILSDNSLRTFSQKSEIEIYNLSKFSYLFPEEITDKNIVNYYQTSRLLLEGEYDDLLQLKSDLDEANKNYQSNLLLKSGRLRAKIFDNLQSKNLVNYQDKYFEDLLREIKLIPYRPIAIFYNKILQYSHIAQSGFSGIFYIIKQLVWLAIFIGILLISKFSLNKLNNSFNKVGQLCVKKSTINKSYLLPAKLLIKFTPYFKWLLLILIFSLAQLALDNTLLEEIGVLVPYFQIYFIYRIFKIFSYSHLNNLIYQNFEESGNRQSLTNKIKKATNLVGVYLLSSFYLLYLTASIIRKVYFYNLVFDLFVIGLIALLAFVSSGWKNEIKKSAKNNFSKSSNKIIIKLFANNNLGLIFSLPIFCFIVLKRLLRNFILLLRNYDFFKNILSQIYRRKLESASKQIDQDQDLAPEDSYLKAFLSTKKDREFIDVKDHPYVAIEKIINDWLLEKSEENSVAIYGDQGIGKTEFVEKLTSNKPDLKIIKLEIDQKITKRDGFLKAISKVLGKEMEEKDLFKFLLNINQKTIILIDDCDDLFLAKEGGFEALRMFLNFLIKINNPNLLWITTFNSGSWRYLQNSLKINNYFRHILKLTRWSDENIRQLIMGKHNKTGFKLVFDPLIFAINSNNSGKEFEDLQQKFFQIIWSASKGNPKIAIALWISSLSKKNSQTIKVLLPKSLKTNHLSNLGDEHLFVYAAIIKHHNLSISEISTILSVPKEEVVNIIRIGLEKGYLVEYQSSKRFVISPQWQIAIHSLLTNRNFIYGE
ncbi:MAG: hypothetical protein ACJAZX_000561 [Rickettsiales bacterium]|jgi:hypothetical protein